MSEHVLDELLDYLGDRLSSSSHAEVRAHLAECESCTALYEWAAEFRKEAERQELRHVAPERIVEIESGEGAAASEVETLHLATCETCRAERDWVRGLPPLEAVDELDPKKTKRVVPLRRLPWIAVAAAALAALFFLPRNEDDRPDLAELARIEPLPVRLQRGPGESTPFEEARLLGLERYAGGDYAGAAEALERALDERPDAEEVRLYLASSTMLLGEVEPALALFRAAIEGTTSPRIEALGQWQLANAELSLGRVEEAVSRLEEIAKSEGPLAQEAGALLEAILARL